MEEMLKENKNIDHSYTDRVVRQLVDETEIDFSARRVRLPGPPFAWPFHNFGPGGLENALRMTAGNSFGHHIIDNYGIDEEEFEEVLTKYMGIIEGRIEDGYENSWMKKRNRENPHWLQEQIGHGGVRKGDDEREARYAKQVVDWMVKETKIDDSHEDPSQWNIYAPHMGRWISPLGFISPNNRVWSAFEDHVMDIYGLDWEMVGTAWNNYLKEVTTNFRQLAAKAQGDDTPPWDMQYDYLAESTEDKFLDTIVNQLVNETEIDYDNGIPHISAFPDPDFSMDTSFYLNKDLWENLFGDMFKSFWTHCREVYGLTDAEIQKVWWAYKTEVLKKIEWKGSLDESKEDLDDEVHKAVDDLWDEDKKLKGEDKIKKYFEDKGLNKQDADEAMVQYLSKQQSLNESKEDLDSYIHKVVNRMVGDSSIRVAPANLNRNTPQSEALLLVKLPFHMHLYGSGEREGENVDEINQFYITSPTHRIVNEIRKHLILIYGMDKWEADHAALMYLSKMTDKINDYKREGLNESVDLSYSDDKDFPFLNKLANHTMSVTEIGRNAVMFPFIDGYISDGNLHKYFHGTPYDQLPFEATLKLDEYLRDFGLTENEKEIWWDIYVIKVIDAINERDLKIIDNYGELNESTEDIYDKIVNSVLRESGIFEEGGKLYLKTPAFESSVNVETVLDIMSGMTKRAIPNSFVKHMKEIYNISGGTPIETVWALYRDKMIERIKIKQAQQRQIIPKQQKFFDHILKTLVGATEVQTMKDWNDDETYEQRVWVTPPFLNHGVDVPRYREDSVEWNEFSYFGYGYPRYMKDIYGLTDEEGLKLWAPYYKALQKKVDELIERDRIIYGDE